jgi:hypothetical protein
VPPDEVHRSHSGMTDEFEPWSTIVGEKMTPDAVDFLVLLVLHTRTLLRPPRAFPVWCWQPGARYYCLVHTTYLLCIPIVMASPSDSESSFHDAHSPWSATWKIELSEYKRSLGVKDHPSSIVWYQVHHDPRVCSSLSLSPKDSNDLLTQAYPGLRMLY